MTLEMRLNLFASLATLCRTCRVSPKKVTRPFRRSCSRKFIDKKFSLYQSSSLLIS